MKTAATNIDAGFVICVEPGMLEYKAFCLILTLRQNWARWKNLPLYAYSPRAGKNVSAWMQAVYQQYDVTPVYKVLNTRYYDYPLANKPLCMAHAERYCEHELLIFLDSDILCWHEPDAFALPDGKSLAMTVDTTKTVASYGLGDPYDAMWMALYRLADVTLEPYVVTSLSGERVRGWWGTGVIVTRRSAQLMQRWQALFEQAMLSVAFVPEALYLREQMTMAALAASIGDGLQELAVGYNYQVQNYRHFSRNGCAPEQAVLWHYQPYFDKAFARFARKAEKQTDIDAKIDAAQKFVNTLRQHYAEMIGINEPALRALRRRLQLGNKLRSLFGPGDHSRLGGQ